MNALYEYFFPPTPAPVAVEAPAEPEGSPPPLRIPPKNPTLCFTHKNELFTLSLSDVAGMTPIEIRLWRRMVITHSLETYDMEESDNAALILAELEKYHAIREAEHHHMISSS